MVCNSDGCELRPRNSCSVTWIHMLNGFLSLGMRSDCPLVTVIGRHLYQTDGSTGRLLASQMVAVWRGKAESMIALQGDLNQPQSLAADTLDG